MSCLEQVVLRSGLCPKSYSLAGGGETSRRGVGYGRVRRPWLQSDWTGRRIEKAMDKIDSEQRVLDAWQRWVDPELPHRRSAADRARKRALQTNDEVQWQHAENVERSYRQLQEMVEHGDPYFSRIRGQMEEANGEPFEVDLRVHRYHRSETFSLDGGDEMLDISHLAPLADLVRNPQLGELKLTVGDRAFLGTARGQSGPIRVITCEVEDIELEDRRVVRTAPRYGAIFEDRVKTRLSQAALPALDVLADVLDRDQNAIIGDRDAARRLLILDGSAGTGKTVVAAHRVAVSQPPESPGLYITPTTTLRDYVRPVLPRLGLSVRRAPVWSLVDLVTAVWPDLPWHQDLSGMALNSEFPPERWNSVFSASNPRIDGEPEYRQAAASLGIHLGPRFTVADIAPLLWMAAAHGKRPSGSHPEWIIVDEAQSIPLLAYRTLKAWFGNTVSWILAGDLMQRGSGTQLGGWPTIYADGLEMASNQVGYVWLRHNYRVPANIHAAAERLRSRVLPSSEESDSVPWHPHVGEVQVELSDSAAEMASKADAAVLEWRQHGITAIALIARKESSLTYWVERLQHPDQVLKGSESYRGGVVLTTLDSVRGLEFDAVLLLEVGTAQYPDDDESARALYTALTRARRSVRLMAPKDDPSPWISVICPPPTTINKGL